jgi:acetyltransferase-like isoleucine patch superfamily enzyme
MAVIPTRTTVGRNVCVYSGSTVDHDNRIEDHVFISPGVHTAGQVIVESGAYLGPGVIVASGCRVGRGSIIGAGAVVLSDIPARSVALGTPAAVVQSVDDWIAAK